MELVEIKNGQQSGVFFPQREFMLLDGGVRVCKLMAMEVVAGKKLDLTVVTMPRHQNRGYATAGLKMLISWAVQNNYKEVTLTNISNSMAIDKIAEKLNFRKQSDEIWNKQLVGPLNL